MILSANAQHYEYSVTCVLIAYYFFRFSDRLDVNEMSIISLKEWHCIYRTFRQKYPQLYLLIMSLFYFIWTITIANNDPGDDRLNHFGFARFKLSSIFIHCEFSYGAEVALGQGALSGRIKL